MHGESKTARRTLAYPRAHKCDTAQRPWRLQEVQQEQSQGGRSWPIVAGELPTLGFLRLKEKELAF